MRNAPYINPYPAKIYRCPEYVFCYLHLLHIFRSTSDKIFIMEANNTNSDWKTKIKQNYQLAKLILLFHCKQQCLLIIIANSLDPDQDRQNIGSDLDATGLTLIVGLT